MKHVEGKIKMDTKLLGRKEILFPYLKGKILDVGSGEGEVLIKATLLDYDIRGLERSKREIEVCKETAKLSEVEIEVINGDIENTDFKTETFDTIIMGELIEHLQHPELDVRKVLTWLKPGGMLLITVPSGFAHIDPDHKNFFFKQTQIELLNKLWIFEMMSSNLRLCKIISVEGYFKSFGAEYHLEEIEYGDSKHPSLDMFIRLVK